MENLPHSVSAETINRAARVAESALKIDLNPGTVRWVDGKDMLFFMFTNGPDLSIIFCSPYSFFVEMHTEDEYGGLHENYLMIKNIRNWLFWLKRNNFQNCEHIIDKRPLNEEDEE